MALDMQELLLSQLGASTQSSLSRTNVGAENATQALAVVQNNLVHVTGVAAVTSTLMSDDAQAAMGLNTAVKTPVTSGT